MHNPGIKTSLHMQSALGLVLIAMLAACGSESSNGQTVAVNLSLVVNSQQARNESAVSRIMAFLQWWLPGAASAQAQSVNEIRTIQVQISGPDIPVPPSTSVPVSNPTPGQEIPVSIQAPTGPNRTITVAALDGAGIKIFGGTLPNVTLTPGPPIALVITLEPVFTVTVNKQGNGTGTVTSTPAGIDCGATCAAQFEQGTSVALNAAAAPGSAFIGWSGDCSGTGSCIVTGNAKVTARFNNAITKHLTINMAGTGSGTVTSNPSGISCGTTCASDFPIGSTVVLTASPTGGSTFSRWSGGGCSGTGSCIVVMNADQTVTATFTAGVNTFTLTVHKSGAGIGTVTSSPAGIDCGTTCTVAFASGTPVTLTATPATGSTFAGWSGSGCSGPGTCVVVMTQNQSVTATFNPPVNVTLTINKSGNGDGTVTSNLPGIDCGGTCQATYAIGTTVTLTAVPDASSIFLGWSIPRSGSPCNNQTGPCVLTMDDTRSVNARFEKP